MRDGWKKTTIGNQITLQRGFDITKKEHKPGDVPVVSSGGISGYHDIAMAKAPGVVTGRKGSLGNVYYLKDDFWPHDTTLWVKDFKGNFPRYVFYFLQTLDFLRMDVGSSNPTLNRNHVHPIEICWPPLHEQREIAHILGALDDKIEANRRQNATLEATARAIFKSWFVDFDPVHAKARGETPVGMDAATADLFPDTFQDSALGPIPSGWSVGTIRDCCTKIENGGTPKRSEPLYWEPAIIPWLTSGEVRQKIVTSTENFISDLGLKNSSAKLWKPKTTVVALYGATAGQVALLTIHATANQACCGLSPKHYLTYFVYLHANNSVEKLSMQARGSAQQNLNQSLVANFPTILPNEDILEKFHTKVSVLFEMYISNMHESRTLAETRDALLPRLISGELRVGEVD